MGNNIAICVSKQTEPASGRNKQHQGMNQMYCEFQERTETKMRMNTTSQPRQHGDGPGSSGNESGEDCQI